MIAPNPMEDMVPLMGKVSFLRKMEMRVMLDNENWVGSFSLRVGSDSRNAIRHSWRRSVRRGRARGREHRPSRGMTPE
jgi:hypothetical protein